MFVARAIDQVAGGVERMVTTVMNALNARGHSVEFLTWDRAGATAFYPLADGIAWHKLDMGDPFVAANHALKLKRARAIRSLVRRREREAIVCFQDGPFMAMRAYTAGMGVPVFAAERNAPTRFEHTSAGRRQKLTFNALRFAKRVLIQCESYRELYPAFLRDRIITIPNPVFPAKNMAQPKLANANGRFCILSVGRLSYQKNPEVLVHAFATIAPRFPGWDLVFIGEGEHRVALENLVAQKGLSGRIKMPGPSHSVSDLYAAGHVFCLSSLWEGFPNAVAEAMAHGLPCVGFAGCAGVRDLIIHEQNGLLAEGNGDSQSLAKALEALMGSAEMRGSLGERAVQSVKPYSPDDIFDLWEQTLTKATK